MADFADIFTGRLISEIPLALTALCDALLTVPSLVEVDLSDNAFGGRSVDPMVPFLSQHPTLQILRLANNGLGPAGGTVVANALFANAQAAQQAGRPSALRAVICGRNRLEDGSAPAWAAAFAAHSTLVDVRLYQNGIRMDGIRHLARGLRSCTALEHLDLQDNTATERGSRAIAAALPHWPRLRVLELSDCLLRPKGGHAIALALAKGGNEALEELKLQSDEVDALAIEVLAKAVAAKSLPALRSVELNGNRCEGDSDVIEALRSALNEQGAEDGVDEIDDVEEVDSEEEADEEEEVESEAEDAEIDASKIVIAGKSDAGEAVTASEDSLVAADKVKEERSEPKQDKDASVDELADMLGGATLIK